MKRHLLGSGLPALAAIALFTGVVFLYLLPSHDRIVMDQKRLMIRELTESAWNLMARFEAEEREGTMTGPEARAAAVAQIRNLHYGVENRDYFFVIDEHPVMVVHPYRPDLEGADLTGFADPEGRLLFVEMVRTVERDGHGYVDYMWQWKDDPDRIVPKLSYVKGFEPWGWIIGTGVYTDDVDAEIAGLTGDLQAASLAIIALVALLLVVLLRTNYRSERGRLRATAALQASEETYRSLVESAGEAILMSIPGDGLYANASLLHLLDYRRDDFARLDPGAIIRPGDDERAAGRPHWQAVADGVEAPARYEAELVRSDGRPLRVTLTLSRIVVQGRAGFMAVAARLAEPRELDVATAADLDDLEAASRRTRDLATLMLNHGADAHQVVGLLSTGADDVVRKAVELIIDELGPPPAAFDVMLMGSLGRRETTLLADQDHAIIHDDVPPDDAPVAHAWFLTLGRRISDLLHGAGFPYCEGKIMSGEEACCRSLADWCATFDDWVSALEPEDLLRSRIFFDFRGTLDEGRLVPGLRDHLATSLSRNPRFLPFLAHDLLHYEPPLTTLGRFAVVETPDGRLALDIKGALAQVVDLARLRALQHGVTATGTLDRLDALAASGHLKDDAADTAADAYRTLMEIRLRHQARRRADRLEPDNLIVPDDLDDDDRRRLKDAFRGIRTLQDTLRLEFGDRT